MTRQERAGQELAVPFDAVDTAAPPGMTRADFLIEVQYVSGLPERIDLHDDEAARKLAAAFANRGVVGGSFRFTPSASGNRSKKVQVAVRARASTPAAARRTTTVEPATTTLSLLTPTAYNLGVAIGWKSFAISGDIGKMTVTSAR